MYVYVYECMCIALIMRGYTGGGDVCGVDVYQ